MILLSEFPENFNRPYLAASLREFWRRWHISLSTWLRDYLYISLGGSKKGKFRTKINIMITMLLGGLWHGANLKYIIWGFFHGLFLVLERWKKEAANKKERDTGHSPVKKILKGIFVFHLVCLLWIFFRAEELSIVGEYFSALFACNFFECKAPFLVLLIMLFTILSQFIPIGWCERFKVLICKAPILIQSFLAILMMFLLGVVLPEGVAPFIYYQF